MPGAFHGLNIGSSALRVFQRGLDVTGNNIANVNTPGFSRQTLDLISNDPIQFFSRGAQGLGSGVSIAGINRIRDMFLDARANTAGSEIGRLDVLARDLKQIQGLFNEPGASGIADSLDKFFNAWSALAGNPSDQALKNQVRTAGATLAERVRGVYNNLQTVSTQYDRQAVDTIAQINQLATKVHDLNSQIRYVRASGGQPNDLMDQRDKAIEDLSSLVGVTTRQMSDGTTSVYINQFTLVDQSGNYTVPSTYSAANSRLTFPAPSTTVISITSGKLAGLFQSINSVASNTTTLNSFADQLRVVVNNLHQTGTYAGPPPVTNVPFFTPPVAPATTITAGELTLSTQVQTSLNNVMTSTTGAAGDGALALALSNLRNQSVAALGNRSLTVFYRDQVTALGTQVQSTEASLNAQKAVFQQIDNQRQSISGVSLDEEMSNMLRFQRSYQAAAKFLTTMDQVTEDLINMVRR